LGRRNGLGEGGGGGGSQDDVSKEVREGVGLGVIRGVGEDRIGEWVYG